MPLPDPGDGFLLVQSENWFETDSKQSGVATDDRWGRRGNHV